MTKLISAVAVIALSITSLATAAPGQGAMGRAAERARERADPPHKGPKHGPKALKRDARFHRRDVKADERELRRLRADLRSAERARDWRRAQRDRAAISRLEYQIRANREYNRRYERDARYYGARNDSWWARHLGRTGG